MSRRIDVDPALPPVEIPPRILNEICNHARETVPEECCGLLIGDDEGRFREILRCRNEMTRCHLKDLENFPRDGRTAYYMNPQDIRKAEEVAEASARRVTAVYHSHIGARAYLSDVDVEELERDLFPFPDADQIVVAVVEGRVGEVGLFRKHAESVAFSGHRVPKGR